MKKQHKHTRHSKVFFLMLALLIGSVFIFHSCKGRHHKSMDKMGEHFVEKIVDELDLNNEQEAKLMKINKEIIAVKKKDHNKHGTMLDDLTSIIKSDTVDKSQLISIMKKKHENEVQRHAFYADKFVEFHAILTPEQRIKAAEKMQEWKEKMHGKHK